MRASTNPSRKRVSTTAPKTHTRLRFGFVLVKRRNVRANWQQSQDDIAIASTRRFWFL